MTTTEWTEVLLAALNPNSALPLRGIVLGIVGTVTFIIMVTRMAGAYADERYGKLITIAAAGGAVLWVCTYPDKAGELAQGIAQSVLGTN